MRYRLLALAIFAAFLSACAAHRTAGPAVQQPAANATLRTIFIPEMSGYEKNVASALHAAAVPVTIVDDSAKSDFQVRPTFSNSGGIADVLYEKRTGHAPFSYLDVLDPETKQVLLSYPFLWSDHEETRNRDAQEFARELKKKLAKLARAK